MVQHEVQQGSAPQPRSDTATHSSAADNSAVDGSVADSNVVDSGAIPRPLVMGVETSCDETAVAVVDARGRILAHEVLSQIDDHSPFGGVVPEIAARQHIAHLDRLMDSCMRTAGVRLSDLDALAATTGPGLVGGLMVGMLTTKAAAQAADKPFVAVNHLAAHALTPRLGTDLAFPYLLLLVSGGHAQILEVHGPDDFTRLGTTIDDAVGEAFDKTAKLLGLPYPGGPAVEAAALDGDPRSYDFPRPLVGRDDCNMSFSGLKTAVRRSAEDSVAQKGGLSAADIANICASFQAAITDSLIDRVNRAILISRAHLGDAPSLVVAGGVAANKTIRTALERLAESHGFGFMAPPLDLCTDNGAMIAWAAIERLKIAPDLREDDQTVRPRWPLDGDATPMVGRGKRGAKV